MRPNDLYGWYCVLHSATDILERAARLHVERTSCAWSQPPAFRNPDNDGARTHTQNRDKSAPSKNHQPKPALSQRRRAAADSEVAQTPNFMRSPISELQKHAAAGGVPVIPGGLHAMGQSAVPCSDLHHMSGTDMQDGDARISASTTPSSTEILPEVETTKKDAPARSASSRQGGSQQNNANEPMGIHPVSSEIYPTVALRASKVPSSRIGRMFHYGGLAASLGYGAATEILRRSSSPKDPIQSQPPLLMTESNLNRLVSKLSQMRGAALKLGQFMSIQDSHVLPEELERVFRRVQDGAHYMPNWQMESVMSSALGPSWRSHFRSFRPIPSHSASIGQVHTGVLAAASSPSGKDEEVAIKVQFPKIAESISSDLGYVKLILGASALLPKGLFLDSTIKAFKKELADECDYKREARYIRKFRDTDFIQTDGRYRVPWVWDGSTENVLVMERMNGVSVGGDIVKTLSRRDRDEIASRIVELCLRELFEFRMMQTDPNWTNFLWNQQTRQIELIDFGATREYSTEFIDSWLRLLAAAVDNDRDACIDWSRKLGYFIGGENEAMVDAHLTSMQLLGTPFRHSTPQPFSFSRGSTWTDITSQIRAQIPVMLNNRLTPPPRETYSLNRKLSGAFLLAGRLEASVDCRSIWEKVVDNILRTS